MKLKRTVAALLCAGVLMAGMTACTKSDVREYTPPAESAEVTSPPLEAEFEDTGYAYAYEKYAPDTLVLTINGLPVYWSEFFYWIAGNVGQIESYFGPIEDWDGEWMMDASLTNAQYILQSTEDPLKQYRSLESNIAELDIKLDADGEQRIIEEWDGYVMSYAEGDEEVFINEYLTPIFLTKEIYMNMLRIESFYEVGFEAIYGDKGANFSDEDVETYLEDSGMLMAKHILISTVDDAGADLSEEEIAEKTALAENILAQLEAADDLDAKFDELMNEYTEDPGIAAYPDGYVFGTGEMVPEFEDGTKALEVGAISGLVKSSYGYHIIMRLPIDAETTTDNGFTMREAAAMAAYDAKITSWKDEAILVWEPEFENLDFAALFAK